MDARLRELIALHFEPRWGAPWWLERAPGLGFDPREVACAADLARFGPMPLDELARRPVPDFIPRRFHDRLAEFVTCETGGTTGPTGSPSSSPARRAAPPARPSAPPSGATSSRPRS